MDAGNRSMRAGNRTVWNDDDRNRAGEVIAYLSVVTGRIDPEDYATCGWGEFSPEMHTRYPVCSCQPDSDLRPARGILLAAFAGGLIWLVVICLLSH